MGLEAVDQTNHLLPAGREYDHQALFREDDCRLVLTALEEEVRVVVVHRLGVVGVVARGEGSVH